MSCWCVGYLEDRNGKNDGCIFFLRNETDLLNPKNNVWEVNSVSSVHNATDVKVKCTKEKRQRGIFVS